MQTPKYHLRELRARRNISQKELSQASGVSEKTIWSLENTEGYYQKIKFGTLEQIASVLNVKVDDIFFN